MIFALFSLFLFPFSADSSNTETKVNIVLNKIQNKYPDWNDKYNLGQFDCSEMSAFVSFMLDMEGINNSICVSRSKQHAWVEVPLNNNKSLLIESTKLVIVNDHSWYYKNNDVYHKTNMVLEEVDWWNELIPQNKTGISNYSK